MSIVLAPTAGSTVSYTEQWSAHAGCSPTTDDVVGYVVVQTIDDAGSIMAKPVVVASFDNPARPFAWTNAYTEALELARSMRKVRGSWAVVAHRYECGHIIW